MAYAGRLRDSEHDLLFLQRIRTHPLGCWACMSLRQSRLFSRHYNGGPYRGKKIIHLPSLFLRPFQTRLGGKAM